MNDSTGQGIAELLNRITTNHTFFMRETAHFDFFQDTVIPYLKMSVKDRDLRIWSAGCSSGEEPYTLGMIINDSFRKEKDLWNTSLLATDISLQAIEKAKKGIYSKEAVGTLPAIWKRNYFLPHDSENYIISDTIKKDMVFRRFNLMEETFPFKKKFHGIFCRNVMIYFDQITKDRLIDKFYNHLAEGGYLFIGHSESINRTNCKFRYVKPAVYRKYN